MVDRVGLEPTTNGLKGHCSTTELPIHVLKNSHLLPLTLASFCLPSTVFFDEFLRFPLCSSKHRITGIPINRPISSKFQFRITPSFRDRTLDGDVSGFAFKMQFHRSFTLASFTLPSTVFFKEDKEIYRASCWTLGQLRIAVVLFICHSL